MPLHALLLAVAASAVGGCGWTPRDEFLHNRQTVIRSEPGDGSRYTFQTNSDSPLAAERAGVEVVLTEEP